MAICWCGSVAYLVAELQSTREHLLSEVPQCLLQPSGNERNSFSFSFVCYHCDNSATHNSGRLLPEAFRPTSALIATLTGNSAAGSAGPIDKCIRNRCWLYRRLALFDRVGPTTHLYICEIPVPLRHDGQARRGTGIDLCRNPRRPAAEPTKHRGEPKLVLLR